MGSDRGTGRENDRDAEALVRALQGHGWRVLAAIEQEATGRLAAVRLSPEGEAEDGVVVDLLFASSGIEPEIVAAAEVIEILPALWLPVARLGHLIALKILARDDRTRPQDAGDLTALIRNADDAAITAARDALGLVAMRGYHRGRDLAADLETALGHRRR